MLLQDPFSVVRSSRDTLDVRPCLQPGGLEFFVNCKSVYLKA